MGLHFTSGSAGRCPPGHTSTTPVQPCILGQTRAQMELSVAEVRLRAARFGVTAFATTKAACRGFARRNGWRSLARLFVVMVSLVAGAGAAAAQGRTGTIAGVVKGDDGNRLPGVTVTVENQAAGIRKTATTDADGQYDVSDVPADGEYVVGASLVG